MLPAGAAWRRMCPLQAHPLARLARPSRVSAPQHPTTRTAAHPCTRGLRRAPTRRQKRRWRRPGSWLTDRRRSTATRGTPSTRCNPCRWGGRRPRGLARAGGRRAARWAVGPSLHRWTLLRPASALRKDSRTARQAARPQSRPSRHAAAAGPHARSHHAPVLPTAQRRAPPSPCSCCPCGRAPT